MTLINLYRYLFKVQILFFVDASAANVGVVDPETREIIYGSHIIKFIIDTLIEDQLTGYEFYGEIKICHYSLEHSYEHVHGFAPDADIYVADSAINGVANPNLSYFM